MHVCVYSDTDSFLRQRCQSVVRKWPFEKAHRRACALVSTENGRGRFYAAGAAKPVLDRCSQLLLPGDIVVVS